MKRVFSLLLILLVAFVLAMGCGDDDDDDDDNKAAPTDNGGTTAGELTTHEGDNAPVTESNVEAVTREINVTAWDVFGRALPTAQKPAVGYTRKFYGEVEGKSGGKANAIGTTVTELSGQAPSSVTYDITCDLYNFSDDGEMWLGGRMQYNGDYDYTKMIYNITVYGNIEFNGAYQGSQNYVTTIKMDMTQGTQTYTVTTETTSNGKTFSNSFTF